MAMEGALDAAGTKVGGLADRVETVAGEVLVAEEDEDDMLR